MCKSSAPTIKDVARLAGVSVGTASHVLHGKSSRHTQETARKVVEAAGALGYQPNRIARSLVERRTRTLAIVVEHGLHGRLPRNTYLIGVLDGFLEATSAAGYQIKVVTLLQNDPAYVASELGDGSTDGVALVAPRTEGAMLAWARSARSPVVVIGSTPPDTCLPQVDVDDERAIYDAVGWMIRLGHRHIAIVTGPRYQRSAERRERGYRRALADAGIPWQPEWRYEGDYTAASGHEGVGAFMSLRPRPTAIVCGNDWVAIGAATELLNRGVRIPEDVSVLGLDGIEAASWFTPPLATIRQPMDEIGKQAVQLLVEQIERGERNDYLVLFPGTLVPRQSVGPAAA